MFLHVSLLDVLIEVRPVIHFILQLELLNVIKLSYRSLYTQCYEMTACMTSHTTHQWKANSDDERNIIEKYVSVNISHNTAFL